ncbi:C1q-like domain-containing protein [Paenibacillus harenae]|uniref:C1q domain-containing protein n=1 Tax=Paenibacillus harenae TaxID=306543 RepID=A0ABT9UB62_PAEHA|nr:ABC transporter permease [Paenibacillus harenae]MDQ0116246.1 hypothetical protein [Paenibacillus harenae]
MISKQALRKKMLTSGLKKKCGPKRHTKRPVLCKRKGSAFSAVSNADQPINQFVQVQFNQEVFDLNNEYNPATSIFTAKRSGVYVFFASIGYQPATDVAGTVSIAILANERILVDSEAIRLDGTIVSVTGIVQLRAGDRVVVFAAVFGGSGVIEPFATRFEGSRVQ